MEYRTENDADWQDTLYRRIFDEESVGLCRRREADQNCVIADIEGLLESLYDMEGADWLGRGEVQNIILSAQIAAHEQFIAQWRKEIPT